MNSGTVFDIREFTVHDGPGLRTTVFLKGCPLRCAWCHNPEGQKPCVEILKSAGGERVSGRIWTAEALAARLNRQSDILRSSGGGVSFSGGEPLSQAEFLVETMQRLEGVHVLLETSGYGTESAFRSLSSLCDMVYFDLKLIDPAEHLRYTGKDNGPILRNFDILDSLGVHFVVRVPLVPGVTDTQANLRAIARLLKGRKGFVRTDLLPYNRAAGGKYKACGMEFSPCWDEKAPCRADTSEFDRVGVYAKAV